MGTSTLQKLCSCFDCLVVTGNYETRNGTERGTEVRCGPRARLDWTHPKICKMPFSV